MQNVCQTLLTCLHASVNGAKADLCGVPDSHDNILEAQKLNQLINTQINATTGSSSYLVLIHKFYLSFLSLLSESDSRQWCILSFLSLSRIVLSFLMLFISRNQCRGTVGQVQADDPSLFAVFDSQEMAPLEHTRKNKTRR